MKKTEVESPASAMFLRNMRSYAERMLRRMLIKHTVVTCWDKDKGTARTTGLTIWYNRDYVKVQPTCKRLTKRILQFGQGITLHEIGHFFQPLRKTNAVVAKFGVSPQIDNLLLDAQLETVIFKVYPKDEVKKLKYCRALTKRAHFEDYIGYIADLESVEEFNADVALRVLLMARFVKPGRPLANGATKEIIKDFLQPSVLSRACQFLDFVKKCPTRFADLPVWYEKLFTTFPEICSKDEDSDDTSSGEDSDDTSEAEETSEAGGASGGEETDKGDNRGMSGLAHVEHEQDYAPVSGGELDEDQARDLDQVLSDLSILVEKKLKRGPALPEALVLSQKIKLQLQETTGSEYDEDIDLYDRRLGAIGADLPYYAEIPIGKNVGHTVVIGIDCTGSMIHLARKAFTAAQAIALAVKATNGEVIGLDFSRARAHVDRRYNDNALFPPDIIGAIAGDGTFQWLTELSRKYPDAPKIIITDGDEPLPNKLPNDKQRALTYIIGLKTGLSPSLVQISDNIVYCDDIKKLPQILVEIVKKH